VLSIARMYCPQCCRSGTWKPASQRIERWSAAAPPAADSREAVHLATAGQSQRTAAPRGGGPAVPEGLPRVVRRSQGGSTVMVAKGNRSRQVTEAWGKHGGLYLPVQDWTAALNHLSIVFEGRIPV
jgi:hypothetical protein